MLDEKKIRKDLNKAIEETIRKDLKQAILDKDEIKKDALRMIIGEIPRLNKKANEKATNQEVISIIRKLIKAEKTVLELSEMDVNDSLYTKILNEYIPKLMTGEEIVSWISKNINLDDFDPKIKAMGSIMKNLKGKVDGNLVKQILLSPRWLY